MAPYNTGPLPRQFGTVVRKIVKLAFPPKQYVANLLPFRSGRPQLETAAA